LAGFAGQSHFAVAALSAREGVNAGLAAKCPFGKSELPVNVRGVDRRRAQGKSPPGDGRFQALDQF
jgi:hypothetical protein